MVCWMLFALDLGGLCHSIYTFMYLNRDVSESICEHAIFKCSDPESEIGVRGEPIQKFNIEL